MKWKGCLRVVVFLPLWAELFPAACSFTPVLQHTPWTLPGGKGDDAYHGMSQDENGQPGVIFLHEINVLQAVPDEDVEI